MTEPHFYFLLGVLFGMAFGLWNLYFAIRFANQRRDESRKHKDTP